MPVLVETTGAILCATLSSVPSERLVSTFGKLLNKKRPSFKGKDVDMLILIDFNR